MDEKKCRLQKRPRDLDLAAKIDASSVGSAALAHVCRRV